MAKKPKLVPPKINYLPFQSGLDTETPPWSVPDGSVRSSQNFEIDINEGYLTHAGYERFDGQAAPSAALYILLPVTITGSFSVGDTVTQLVSGATGVVIAVVTTNTPNELIMTKVTGAFNSSDDLQVSASTEGAAAGDSTAAATTLLHAQYTNLAADDYRDDIAAVPGSGDIRGIWMNSGVSDTKYAFRNNAGATAVDIYKSSASGWTLIDLGEELIFTSGGTFEVKEGDTITGATSTETATVERIVLDSGTWAAGTAAGRLILSGQSGAFQAEDLDVGANLNVATIAADSDPIILLPNGIFEFMSANFGGQLATKRMYGCDSVNRGFEFDGSVLVPIESGMTADTPTHVAFFKNHLFFSFAGSVQHSGPGEPYSWSPIQGAGEIATGDTVTGFMSEPGATTGATLGVYNRNTSHMLHGNDSGDWVLVKYRDEVGALAGTIQQPGITVFFDDRGITTLRTAFEHGNFNHATISSHIQSVINDKRSLSAVSCISREKDQYRLFFSDNTALYVTMRGGKSLGIMQQSLAHVVISVFSLENMAGQEEIVFGSDDGFVYQMEKGTSFDGANILSLVNIHNYYLGSLRTIKRFFTSTMQAQGTGYSEIDFSYEYNFSDVERPYPSTESIILDSTAQTWDFGEWDDGSWDGEEARIAPVVTKMTGSAESVSFVIQVDSDYLSPVTISGILMQYNLRRQLR